MELTDFALIALGGVVVYFVALQGVRAAVKKESKVNAIETLVRQIGFKNMKVQDLNADKLDDKGFVRLVQLLREIRATSGSTLSGLTGGLGQLEQLGQLMQQLPQRQSPATPANPRPSNPLQTPSSETK